jgi:hypothetical protein
MDREDDLKENDEFDPLAPIKDDELDDELDVLAPAGIGIVKPPKAIDDEDVENLDDLLDEEEDGLNDFGAEDYNAPDNE